MSKRRAQRFAAKLLFQFRVVVDGQSSKRRICEERTILFKAVSAKSAVAHAKRKGKAAQFDYLNDQGSPVHFEFVGVVDLLNLGIECAPDEVWYDIRQLLTPMERKTRFVPPDGWLRTHAR